MQNYGVVLDWRYGFSHSDVVHVFASTSQQAIELAVIIVRQKLVNSDIANRWKFQEHEPCVARTTVLDDKHFYPSVCAI